MITPTVYNLLGERNSYFIAPSITFIPAQAGIHRGKTHASSIKSGLPD